MLYYKRHLWCDTKVEKYCVIPFTDSLWREISNTTGIKKERSEQISLNVGLGRMNMKWHKTTPLSKCCSLKEGWEGEGRDGINVYVIPQTLICRATCCNSKRWRKYYVVHPYGTHVYMRQKKKALQKMHAWFIG